MEHRDESNVPGLWPPQESAAVVTMPTEQDFAGSASKVDEAVATTPRSGAPPPPAAFHNLPMSRTLAAGASNKGTPTPIVFSGEDVVRTPKSLKSANTVNGEAKGGGLKVTSAGKKRTKIKRPGSNSKELLVSPGMQSALVPRSFSNGGATDAAVTMKGAAFADISGPITDVASDRDGKSQNSLITDDTAEKAEKIWDKDRGGNEPQCSSTTSRSKDVEPSVSGVSDASNSVPASSSQASRSQPSLPSSHDTSGPYPISSTNDSCTFSGNVSTPASSWDAFSAKNVGLGSEGVSDHPKDGTHIHVKDSAAAPDRRAIPKGPTSYVSFDALGNPDALVSDGSVISSLHDNAANSVGESIESHVAISDEYESEDLTVGGIEGLLRISADLHGGSNGIQGSGLAINHKPSKRSYRRSHRASLEEKSFSTLGTSDTFARAADIVTKDLSSNPPRRRSVIRRRRSLDIEADIFKIRKDSASSLLRSSSNQAAHVKAGENATMFASQELFSRRGSRGSLSSFEGGKSAMSTIGSTFGSSCLANASLFENFDRNWLQDRKKRTEIAMERMCLASFALVFEGIGTGFPYQTYSGLSKSSSCFTLPTCENVFAGALVEGNQDEGVLEKEDLLTMPIQVVKLLWSEIVLKSLPEIDGAEVDLVGVLPSIVSSLTDDLNFLTKVEINGVQCLRLAHETYTEYGTYIIEGYRGVEHVDEVICEWHGRFADVLKKSLFSKKKRDVHGEVDLYAALALPRHMFLSSDDIDDHSYHEKDDDCCHLLADTTFVARRMAILACRLGASTCASRNKIEAERISSVGVVRATQIHISDIERVLESTERGIDSEIVDIYGAWEVACQSILGARSTSERHDENPLPRSQKRQHRTHSTLSFVHGDTPDTAVPDNASTTGSSEDDLVNEHGATLAPAELQNIAEDRRLTKKFSRRDLCGRARTGPKTKLVRQKKVSFTFDKSEDSAKQSKSLSTDAESDVASSLTGSFASRRFTSSARFKADFTAESRGVTLSDVLNIDIRQLKREVAVAKSIYLLSRSLCRTVDPDERHLDCLDMSTSSVSRTLSTIAARMQIRLGTASVEQYALTTGTLSYLLSDDLDEIDEEDLVEMQKNGANFSGDLCVTASERLRCLHADKIEAQSLVKTVQLLGVEAWYGMGFYLAQASDAGLPMKELADTELLLRLGILGVGSGQAASSFPISDDFDSIFDETGPKVRLGSSKSSESSDRSLSVDTEAIACYRIAYSLLKPLVIKRKKGASKIPPYSYELKAGILHELGYYQYERRGDMKNSLKFFIESIEARRNAVQDLQEDGGEELLRGRASPFSGSIFTASLRGGVPCTRSWQESAEAADTHALNPFTPSNSFLKLQIPSIEASLSLTIEFAALAEHALTNYKPSLAYFHEAIILRATHAGKGSLDVAGLQFNMGVVHDDFGEYEASINRYSESLRIRLDHLEDMVAERESSKDTLFGSSRIDEDINELEVFVVLTLKCMGNVYRTIHQFQSALECYLSAIDIFDMNMALIDSNSSCLRHCNLMENISSFTIPLPELVLDEMLTRSEEVAEKGSRLLASEKSREALERNVANGRSGVFAISDEHMTDIDKMLREMANIYSIVIQLVDLKKDKRLHVRTPKEKLPSATVKVRNIFAVIRAIYGSGRSAVWMYRRSVLSRVEDVEDVDSIVLSTAYNLGKLYIHFSQFQSSIEFLEHSLRTLWARNASDSSYLETSQSDLSDWDSSAEARKSRPSHRNVSSSLSRKGRDVVEHSIEEGTIYHLMAKSHAALSDHERAVRCYVTGLRHYKRGSGDLKIAAALYDCGLSYWRLEDFSAAEKCWSDCYQHLNGADDTMEKRERRANVMYNIAAATCALGNNGDPTTREYLTNASAIYQLNYSGRGGASESQKVGHCYFYLALIEFRRAFTTRQKLLLIVPAINIDGGGVDGCKRKCAKLPTDGDWGGGLKTAISYLETAQQIYDSHLDLLDEHEIKANRSLDKGDCSKDVWGIFHPMQAHISHLRGLIFENLGLFDKSTKEYASALRLSNVLYGPTNVHSASILHRMGIVFGVLGHNGTALKCFDDSFAKRRTILGLKNSTTVATLFDMAGLYARMGEYETAVKAYDDCVKIRIATEGMSSAGVIDSLTCSGIIHARLGAIRKARDCFSGALKISKDRVSRLKHSFETSDSNEDNEKESDMADMNRREIWEGLETLCQEKKRMARILHNIANVHFGLMDSSKALFCFEEALRIRRWLCGHHEASFGKLDLTLKQLEDSGANLEEICRYLDEKKNHCNEENLNDLADTLHSMGCVFEATNKLEHALTYYNEALIFKRGSSASFASSNSEHKLSSERKSTHPESLTYAKTLIRIGCVQSKLGNFEVALSHLEPGLRLQRRHLGRDHPNIIQTLSQIGRCLRYRRVVAGSSQGSSEAVALKCYGEALRISKLRYGPNHLIVAGILYDRGSILNRRGDHSEAMLCYRQSLRVYGREYARSMWRNLIGTYTSSQGNSSSNVIDATKSTDKDLDPSPELVAPDGMTVKEKYLRGSLAFRECVVKHNESSGASTFCTKSDSSDCLTWFELMLLQMFEYVGILLIDPVKNTIKLAINETIQKVDNVGANAIITAKDTMQLYDTSLIQD